MYSGWLRVMLIMLIIFSILGVIGAAAMVGVWYVRGGRILSVQTGSMVPTFRPGDGVLVQRVWSGSLKVGDIISYHSMADPQVTISHRIIAVYAATQQYQTKGDNLTESDPLVHQSQVIGRVTAVAPMYGRVHGWLRRPLGLVVVVYVPGLLLITSEVRRYYARQAERWYHLRG